MSLSTLPLTVFERDRDTAYYRVIRIALTRLHGISIFHNVDGINGALVLVAQRASVKVFGSGNIRIVGV